MENNNPTIRTIHTSVGNPNYNRQPKTDKFCVNCQKDIKPGNSHRIVHLIGGGDEILHPVDECRYQSDDGDCGFFPIGNDCAKRFGLEWSIPADNN